MYFYSDKSKTILAKWLDEIEGTKTIVVELLSKGADEIDFSQCTG